MTVYAVLDAAERVLRVYMDLARAELYAAKARQAWCCKISVVTMIAR